MSNRPSKGLIVHHDQMGIGKVIKVCEDGIWCSFLFYAPELLVSEDSLTVVNGLDVNVEYHADGFKYNQANVFLEREGEVIFPDGYVQPAIPVPMSIRTGTLSKAKIT